MTGRTRPTRKLAAWGTAWTTGVALALGAALPGVPTAANAAANADDDKDWAETTAVVGGQVIGKSARGRKIHAWRLGRPGEQPDPKADTVVLISTMHGDEPATQQILTALRDGPPIGGIDLWVVPVYNPDGLAAGTRRNGRGVDLNRNYPHGWTDLDGNYESGPKPASEPETRAMMRFLRKVRPDWILSFHQPLHAVDTGGKDPAFSRRVADKLNLPRRPLTCGGVCHGTMTSWYNHNFQGVALTVEYGARPGHRLMREIAPDQVLSIFRAVRPARPSG